MPWDITPLGLQPKPESLEERMKARFAYHDHGFFSTMTNNDWQGRMVSYGYLGYISGGYTKR
jgi:hypothetical protein